MSKLVKLSHRCLEIDGQNMPMLQVGGAAAGVCDGPGGLYGFLCWFLVQVEGVKL